MDSGLGINWNFHVISCTSDEVFNMSSVSFFEKTSRKTNLHKYPAANINLCTRLINSTLWINSRNVNQSVLSWYINRRFCYDMHVDHKSSQTHFKVSDSIAGFKNSEIHVSSKKSRKFIHVHAQNQNRQTHA